MQTSKAILKALLLFIVIVARTKDYRVKMLVFFVKIITDTFYMSMHDCSGVYWDMHSGQGRV